MQKQNKKVLLIRTNLTDRDPWLVKEIETLTGAGYEVTLLAWNRERKVSERKETTGKNYREINLNLKAPWGIKVIPFLPIWWSFVFFKLLHLKWDIAQAINFDSIMPATLVAKLKRRPVIYQVYDVYADHLVLPQFIRQIDIFWEKIFMRLADAVILSNETQVKEVNGVPNHRTVPIYNPPPDVFNKAAANRTEDMLTLFYAGVLYRSRHLNLKKVFQAVKEIDGVKLVIAGYGDQVPEIEQWAAQTGGKVEFIGKISYPEVLERTMNSDLLFALYSSSVPTVKYAASCNKLMEAMMAEKPIIVTRDTAMADIVEKEDCGLTADPGDIAQIRQAILTLKNDPELRRRLGANGRKAYEQKYSREIMEKRLLDLYDTMSHKASGS